MTDAQYLEFVRISDDLGGVAFPPDFSAEKAETLMQHVRSIGALIMQSDSAELYRLVPEGDLR